MEYTLSGEDGEGEGGEERSKGGGEGAGRRREEAGGGCPNLRRGCCHCGHLSEEVAASTWVAPPGKKATDESGRDANQVETGRPRKSDGSGPGGDPGARLGLTGIPGGHQSGPQVRVQQHTAEFKERIAECIDEEIVDAPVPHQSSDRALDFLENPCRLAGQQSQVRKTPNAKDSEVSEEKQSVDFMRHGRRG